MQVTIIGAGLFGSMAATLARWAGHRVTLIDSGKPMAASKCAACLFKRSWMGGLSAEQVETGYRTLAQLYKIQQIEFALPDRKTTLDWVDPGTILLQPDRRTEVIKLEPGTVLVAAGAYCTKLVEMPSIRGLVGAALYVPGKIAPQMHVYAPYRQAMAFNIAPKQIWAGDGCAILEKNWHEAERVQLLRERAKEFFQLDSRRAEVRVGARPYVPGQKGYFARVAPRVWVSTGGAKNGTILAAYQAYKFVEAIS